MSGPLSSDTLSVKNVSDGSKALSNETRSPQSIGTTLPCVASLKPGVTVWMIALLSCTNYTSIGDIIEVA